MPFLWFVTMAAAALAGFVLVVGFAGATAAPQEAAVAALACAIAIIRTSSRERPRG